MSTFSEITADVTEEGSIVIAGKIWASHAEQAAAFCQRVEKLVKEKTKAEITLDASKATATFKVEIPSPASLKPDKPEKPEKPEPPPAKPTATVAPPAPEPPAPKAHKPPVSKTKKWMR